MISKPQVKALAAGDAWLEKGGNPLLSGPPGVGKSQLAAALGRGLIDGEDGASSSAGPPISSRSCKSPGTRALEAAIDSSINITFLCWTIWPSRQGLG